MSYRTQSPHPLNLTKWTTLLCIDEQAGGQDE